MIVVSMKNQILNIKKYLSESHISLTDKLFNEFLNILNNFFAFQEEGIKITPKVIIGHGIESEGFKNVFKGTSIIHIKESNVNNISFYQCIKPLLPFCNTGWIIYIDVSKNLVSFGILKLHSTIDGLTTGDLLLSADSDNLFINYGVCYIYINIKYKNSAMISNSVNDEQLCINYSFDDTKHGVSSNCLKELLNDVLLQNKSKSVYKCFEKIFGRFEEKLHGCILLVVNDKFSCSEDKSLEDGIRFDVPINLLNIVEDVLYTDDNILSA